MVLGTSFNKKTTYQGRGIGIRKIDNMGITCNFRVLKAEPGGE